VRRVLATATFVSILFSFAALADSEVKVPEAKLDAKKDLGWTYGLELGVTTNWGYDYRFVGVTDGHYLGLGGKVAGKANYLEGEHEWRNTLSVLETFNKTPAFDAIVKSADRLSFESVYLWNVGGWWGFFAQASADTSIFEGEDIRAAVVTYDITDIAGNHLAPVNANSLVLTSMFLPFNLKQAAGAFVRPFTDEEFKLEIKGGVAFRETFANNQLVITGQTGNTVSVGTLANFYQIGPAVGALAHGDLLDKRLSYAAGIDVSYNAFRSSDKVIGTDLGSRTNLEMMAKLSLKLVEWAALVWDAKALRIPDISTDVQLQTNLLLTFSYMI